MEENKYELAKFVDDELVLEVNVSPKEETIWLTQEEIAKLFDKARNTITEHINKVYKNKELDENLTCRKNRQVRFEGERKIVREIKYYNLDLIILVGYRVNSLKAQTFRKWANNVLKDYLLKGYVINENRVVVTNENFNNLLLVVNDMKSEQIDMKNRVKEIEKIVCNKQCEIDQILYNGQFYDAYTLIQSIFESANNEIIIIDNYIDRTILDRLVVKKQNVKVIIYTNNNTSNLLLNDINTFNRQYGSLTIIHTSNVHDRYVIIDKSNLYHIGASIKDLGKKIFSISESNSNLIPKLLRNI